MAPQRIGSSIPPAPGLSEYRFPPTKEDWLRIKPIFIRLYQVERKTLKALMLELAEKHNFRATRKMCKDRITEWHLARSLRKHEVENILGILAQRKAQHKGTIFILRGIPVDLRKVDSYVRRKGMRVSRLEEIYRNGQSKDCPDLQAFSPKAEQPLLAQPVLAGTLEAFLHEARDLYHGLLDADLCKAHDVGIAFEFTEVDEEIAELQNADWPCSSSTLHFTLVRRLALLLERTVSTYNMYSLSHLLNMLVWIAKDDCDITRSLLDQMARFIDVKLQAHCPQSRWLRALTRLSPPQLFEAFLALQSLMVDVSISLKPDDLTWSYRMQFTCLRLRYSAGLHVEAGCWLNLFEHSLELFGPLEEDALQLFLIVLSTNEEELHKPSIQNLLTYLTRFEYLKCHSRGLVFDGQPLSFWEAWYLINVYEKVGLRRDAARMIEMVLVCSSAYELRLQQEHDLLSWLARLSESTIPETAEHCRRRILEISDIWASELEAAVPTDSLRAACRVGADMD